MRGLNKVKQHLNRIKGGQGVDPAAFDTKLVETMFDLYSKDFCLLSSDLSYENRYVELLKLLTNIKANFGTTFKKTVDNMPGMKVYLMTRTIFDVEDGRSNADWVVKFMAKFLTPTDKDFEDYNNMYPKLPDELKSKLEIFDPILISKYEDDIIIEFGMWKRDENDRIRDVITVTDQKLLPSTLITRTDLDYIIGKQGVLDMSSGELVIEQKYME